MTIAKPRSRYRLDLVTSTERLRALYALDLEAYGRTAIDWERFLQWHSTYDMGLRVVLEQDRIVGAIGVWGLSEQQTRGLIGGQLREQDLIPLTHEQLGNGGSPFWYVSGVVVDAELRRSLATPLKLLLRAGVGQIFNSGKPRYPANVYALAYSDEGRSLLDGLRFQEIKPASELPDECPLYWRQFKDRSDRPWM